MQVIRKSIKWLVISILLLITITGCMTGTQPKDTATFYEDPEIPKGPGLFSGEDGEFVLYSSDKEKKSETLEEDREKKCGCESE